MYRTVLSTLAVLLHGTHAASSAKFSEYIIAPSSRSVEAVSVIGTTGSVNNTNALIANGYNTGAAVLAANSSVTLDFGINIAGTVEFDVQSVSGNNSYIGFSFTESSMWISPYQCDSGTAALFDSPLWFSVPAEGNIWHNTTGSVSLQNLRVNFTASPELEGLKDYKGYFNSDSDKVNRVWYAGAYTNQLCSADPAYGNSLGIPGDDWYYNATIANCTSVLMDGAKRDRLVWPGDVIISAPSIFVSIGNLDSIKNAIDSLFILQQPDGRLPWAGVPFTDIEAGVFRFSFTYHLYTLLDLYIYYIYSGNIATSLATIDSSNLANVSSPFDWLRSGMGGHNVEANAILYHTLDLSARLATELNGTAQVANWTSAMSGIKTAINEKLWDPSTNLFFENDANQTDAATISPFASGFELQAHYLAGFPDRAVELTEFMWADFMLDDPRMTNSSFIEGYATNGSLHYAPYDNDARISHAHGWATGPTSALTFLGAGLRVTSALGRTWLGGGLTGGFETPEGTEGTLILPGGEAVVVEGPSGVVQPAGNGTAAGDVVYEGLVGGKYSVKARA
ncbi:Six-hairpin glycosidase [Byssothecium circinans]|uniref:Six-hairpin glycosidase n=1 Tax=Byssothecium circinans TaxID=147558 RepID=A0A6A5U9K7_9PLEO|nr:Six-hairpin glycosidase [Byssothecium circinans]